LRFFSKTPVLGIGTKLGNGLIRIQPLRAFIKNHCFVQDSICSAGQQMLIYFFHFSFNVYSKDFHGLIFIALNSFERTGDGKVHFTG